MQRMTIDHRIYGEAIRKTVELLIEKNGLSEFFDNYGPYEMAMIHRLFGKQLCDTLKVSGDMTSEQTIKMMEATFESNSKVAKNKKAYSPRGYTTDSIREKLPKKTKCWKDISPKVLSMTVMKELRNWGYIEHKDVKGSRVYRINGYKRDFLNL